MKKFTYVWMELDFYVDEIGVLHVCEDTYDSQAEAFMAATKDALNFAKTECDQAMVLIKSETRISILGGLESNRQYHIVERKDA